MFVKVVYDYCIKNIHVWDGRELVDSIDENPMRRIIQDLPKYGGVETLPLSRLAGRASCYQNMLRINKRQSAVKAMNAFTLMHASKCEEGP